MSMVLLLVLGLVPAVGAQDAGAHASQAAGEAEHVRIEVLSNRADLVSGGDALVEVLLPADADARDLRVDVDGRDVTAAVQARANGRILGLVDGLADGANVLTAQLADGRGARITLHNHPIAGPVFSGPHLQPWVCTTEEHDLGEPDEDCNAPARFDFFYRPTGGGGFSEYDPEDPPSDVATITTDEGEEVPYIVRRETGAMNRGIYAVAVLYNPDEPWDAPWEPQRGWNGKVLYLFGPASGTEYNQASPLNVLNDMALSRGFAVANSSLNINGNQGNTVLNAESVMMLSEHIVEQYGEIRYVIGDGLSGGAIGQQAVANAYPGLLDGIRPGASYPEVWSTRIEVADCVMLGRYFNETSPHLWGVAQQRAFVSGHMSPSSCVAWDATFGPNADPTSGCNIPAEHVYHPEDNPGGTRCTQQDYQINIFGEKGPERWSEQEQAIGRGFAKLPLDNVGVQYGLDAFNARQITAEQFVDLNEKIGAYDQDFVRTEERLEADPGSVGILYRTGQINDGAHLDQVAIIDLRGSSNNEFHTDHHSYAMRERLVRSNGHANNHVQWLSPVALAGDPTWPAQSLELMDRWLAAVEADDSDDPREVKIVRHRPADAVDSCWIAGEQITDRSVCRAAFPYFGAPRTAAGGPTTHDVMKCHLRPLDRDDYDAGLSDGQWERLQAAFPDGVCDWTRPAVDQARTRPWMSFADGPGGVPLGPPPVSVPFGPGTTAVDRHSGATRVETAAAVSGAGQDTADTVIIARADVHADALAGAPLALQLAAPLLLSDQDGLPQATRDEVRRLGAQQAVLLGGAAALGPAVESALRSMGLEVRRVAGPNRFATAAAIAAELPEGREVFLASGEAFADALSASGLAARLRRPILLTATDQLPAESAAVLTERHHVTIVGGAAVVSDEVAAAIEGRVGGVRRLSGPTRYDTSAAVAEEAVDRGYSPTVTWVATGVDFPDGLVAGAAAARDRGVLLLVDSESLERSPASRDWLQRNAQAIANVRIAGGRAAVSDAVAAALGEALAR
jgi:putative cell wall-binding protein